MLLPLHFFLLSLRKSIRQRGTYTFKLLLDKEFRYLCYFVNLIFGNQAPSLKMDTHGCLWLHTMFSQGMIFQSGLKFLNSFIVIVFVRWDNALRQETSDKQFILVCFEL